MSNIRIYDTNFFFLLDNLQFYLIIYKQDDTDKYVGLEKVSKYPLLAT